MKVDVKLQVYLLHRSNTSNILYFALLVSILYLRANVTNKFWFTLLFLNKIIEPVRGDIRVVLNALKDLEIKIKTQYDTVNK